MPESGGKSIKALSIDGGGIRGIIAAVILRELLERVGRPAHETFDLIAGTSTGGIIALGLGTPSQNGKPIRPKSFSTCMSKAEPRSSKRDAGRF